MQEKIIKVGFRLESVAEGVAQVQQSARVSLMLILGDDGGFRAA